MKGFIAIKANFLLEKAGIKGPYLITDETEESDEKTTSKN